MIDSLINFSEQIIFIQIFKISITFEILTNIYKAQKDLFHFEHGVLPIFQWQLFPLF